MKMVCKLRQLQLNIYGKNSWGGYICNFIKGCNHNCFYCFQKGHSVRVGKKTRENWKNEVVNPDFINWDVKYYEDGFMFPQSHDITPQHLDENIIMIRKILTPGNKIFLVTKPHLECVKRICSEFYNYRDTLHFCFTIGSTNSDTLKFWEPGGTSFEERLRCLKLGYSLGFKTSVSSEPLLDTNIDDLVKKLTPFITHHIWIGKMNYPRQTLGMNGFTNDSETMERVEELIRFQTNPQIIRHYYEKYKDNHKVEWKENFRKEILNDTEKKC